MKFIDVQAREINHTHIFFDCPHCINKQHVHGSCEDAMTNRIETRVPHCLKRPYNFEFRIHVTENTKRT